MSIRKLKSRTYVETSLRGACVGGVSTGLGIVLIDTPYIMSDIKQWRASLEKLNLGDVAYLINTHHHYDHCLGNKFYSPNIIAHQLTYEEMSKADGTMRRTLVPPKNELTEEEKSQVYDIPLGLPRFTFNERMRLHTGDTTFELIHVGGHTDSSILVYVVEEKILFTGDDVVSDRHPFVGQANFRQWIKALEIIQQMDVDVVVPGHGDVCGQLEVSRMLEYFRQLWSRVQQLHREGCDKETVVKRTHDLFDFYPIAPGLEAVQVKRFDDGIARLYDQMAEA